MIREATGDDAQAVVELWTEAYVTHGVGGRSEPYTGADFSEAVEQGEVFIAWRGDRIVGVVVLRAPGADGRVVAAPGEAELSRLAVDLTERRAGIGDALVDRCERRAQAAGWSAIALWSRPAQVEAHQLYEARGYRRLPERDSVDSSGHGRLAFRLTP